MRGGIEALVTGQQFKQLYEKEYGELMEQYGIRKVEIDVLYLLSVLKNEDTAKEISKLNHISKAHISKAVEKLSSLEYISLVPDTNDHRMYHMVLTDKAHRLVVKIKSIRKNMLEVMFEGISQEDMDQLQCISDRIIENMERAIIDSGKE